jgi:hypothetical protein
MYIDAGRYEEADRLVAALRQRLGDMDPEVIRLDGLLDLLART